MNWVLNNERTEVIRQTWAEFRSNKQFLDHGGSLKTPTNKKSSNGVVIAGGGGAIFRSVESSSKKKKSAKKTVVRVQSSEEIRMAFHGPPKRKRSNLVSPTPKEDVPRLKKQRSEMIKVFEEENNSVSERSESTMSRDSSVRWGRIDFEKSVEECSEIYWTMQVPKH